ncbi:hypothetical protein BpHYR1_054284 [Brachionus plicatilis]|uniref:Uncharacterized protein n=1 Tax=Brachionus plicatilis TaxID=10195 RepID=A0A3M7S435_BRAPC|nr:hypothetical protein BpHYR1_054284 [Brachionus plicatilis]
MHFSMTFSFSLIFGFRQDTISINALFETDKNRRNTFRVRLSESTHILDVICVHTYNLENISHLFSDIYGCETRFNFKKGLLNTLQFSAFYTSVKSILINCAIWLKFESL